MKRKCEKEITNIVYLVWHTHKGACYDEEKNVK